MLSDIVAERAATIGASPDGRAETIAGATELEPLPGGHLGDQQVLKAIGDRVAGAARRARERVDRVTRSDPVSGDVFVQVAATLEKRLWLIRAQASEAERAAGAPSADRTEDVNGGGGS